MIGLVKAAALISSASIVVPLVSCQMTYRFQVGMVSGELDQTTNAESSNKSIEPSDEQPELSMTTYAEVYN